MARLLESCPIFFTAGNLIWGYILGAPGKAVAIGWAGFAIALLGFFVPKTTLVNYLFKKRIGEKYVHNVRFAEAKQKYPSCQMVIISRLKLGIYLLIYERHTSLRILSRDMTLLMRR